MSAVTRLYWWLRERTINYQLHQTYMSLNPSGCDCRDCRHARGEETA